MPSFALDSQPMQQVPQEQDPANIAPQPSSLGNRPLSYFLTGLGSSLQGKDVSPDLENVQKVFEAQDAKKAQANTVRQLADNPAFSLPDALRQKVKLMSDDQAVSFANFFPKLIDIQNKMTEAASGKKEVEIKAASQEETARHNKAEEALTSQHYASLLQELKNKQGEKAADVQDKAAQKLKDDLDPNKARGGNLAKVQDNLNQADRLRVLYTESNGDIRNLDSRQMEEMAIGLARLLSGSSQPGQETIRALIPPKNLARGQQGIKEWLLNEPQGTNQVEFVKRMAETVERERNLANDKVKEAQIQRLPAHAQLKNTNPDLYNEVLRGYDISPEQIDSNGRYIRSSSSLNAKKKRLEELRAKAAGQ